MGLRGRSDVWISGASPARIRRAGEPTQLRCIRFRAATGSSDARGNRSVRWFLCSWRKYCLLHNPRWRAHALARIRRSSRGTRCRQRAEFSHRMDCDLQGAPTTFVRDAQGQIRGLIVHFETFSVPMARIEASAAQTIMANNDVKLRNQTATPGSESALRRLLDGLRMRKPDYDEMAPWLAELVKESAPLNEPYVRWGAVQSITFTHVDGFGGDEYIVRQEGGFSTWTIWLDSTGIIQDVDNYRMSD